VELSCPCADYEDILGDDGKALLILPIGTTWGWAISFTPLLLTLEGTFLVSPD
jgi:hypothetical protein